VTVPCTPLKQEIYHTGFRGKLFVRLVTTRPSDKSRMHVWLLQLVALHTFDESVRDKGTRNPTACQREGV
jgi:hypothetical protein